MFDFKYFTPTKVLFGKNTEDKVAELIYENRKKRDWRMPVWSRPA